MNKNIGDDILCQILSGLPVKSLLQFKLVCKRWRSLIEDPHFIQLHLSQSKTRPFLLLVLPEGDEIHYFSADLYQGGEAVHRITTPSSLKSDLLTRTYRFAKPLKPINGLICFVRMTYQGGARIYNPSTREETPWIESTIVEEEKELDVELYLKSRYYPQYGFGFDPITKDHKVVCVWDIQRYTNSLLTERIRIDRVCEVFTVGQNTWRKINDVPPAIEFRSMIHADMNYINVNGSIYWFTTIGCPNLTTEGIIAFDVGSEKFRVIPIPDFIVGDTIYANWCGLMEVDGHLTLVSTCTGALTTFKLWMFHDKKSNATTSSNIHWVEETIIASFDWQREQHVSFEEIPGTDLIIIKPTLPMGNHILSLHYYDRKKKIFEKIEITAAVPIPNHRSDFQFSIFVDSLLPVQNQHLHKSNVQRVFGEGTSKQEFQPESA